MFMVLANSPLVPVIMVCASIMVVAFALFMAWRAGKKRRELMRAHAQRMGLAYLEKDTAGIRESLPPMKLFNAGHSRRCYSIIYDESDPERNMMLFDYQYTVGGGKNSHTYQLFVCMLRLNPPLAGINVTIQQEGLLHKVAEMFGANDIDFDDDPDFSKRFLVKSDGSEPAVRRALGPRVRQQLMSWTAKPVPTVAIFPDYLVLAVARHHAKDMPKMDAALQFAIQTRDAILATATA